MDYSEKWGVDVEEAVKLALIDLKLSRDEVEVTVLEEPSKGFFGIGSKLAKVRVEKKKAGCRRETSGKPAAKTNAGTEEIRKGGKPGFGRPGEGSEEQKKNLEIKETEIKIKKVRITEIERERKIH